MGRLASVTKFTCIDGGDGIVRRDMDIILDFLLGNLGQNLFALVLGGSFGRGEGSMAEAADGNLRPLNDYDFLVIVKGESFLPSQSTIRSWEKSCAEAVQIQFIDFDFTTIEGLRKRKPSQVNFDLKWSSVVLHGPDTVLDFLPPFQADEIPAIDAQILLTTRHWCFIGILPVTILEEEERLSDFDQFFAFRQLSKALIAAGDSSLLQMGRYRAGYSEKVKLISSLETFERKDREIIFWGYHFKLGYCKTAPAEYNLQLIFLHALAIHLRQIESTRSALPIYKRLGVIRGLKGIYALVRRRNSGPLKSWVLDYLMLNLLNKLRKYRGNHSYNGTDRLLLKIFSGKWVNDLRTAAAVCAEMRLK